MAAKVAGVHRIFKMGGAQAIAALAYGDRDLFRASTRSWVPEMCMSQTAKRLVFGDVAIESEAGPH